MRIAFVVTRADAAGGASVHVRDLAEALLREGHRPTVLLSGRGTVSDELESAGIPIVELRHLRRSVNPLRDVRAVWETAAALRRLAPDLVSAHTAKAGCIARLACSRLKIPVVYTPHGWPIADRISRRQGALYRVIERSLAPLTKAIVNVCEYERRLALDHRIGTAGQHAVIHNGVHDIPVTLRSIPAEHPPRIAMVARFEEPKDHLTLVAALAGLKGLNWNLDLVGSGPLQQEVRSRVESLGIAGRVAFLGATGEVAARLCSSQILVLSSRSEAFPLSILEGMRAGLPVVASDVGGVREAVLDGGSGYLVAKRSVPALQDALARLIENPALRARFGAAGRRQYEQRFTFRRMFAQTLSLYEEGIGMPAASLTCRA